MEPLLFTVDDNAAGERLDKWLAAVAADLSRSRLQQLLAEGAVQQDGARVTNPKQKVKPGETYLVTIPVARPYHLAPVKLALEIVFEDEHLLVINKPAGLTVHPSTTTREEVTLVHALLAHCADSLSGIGGVMRPGIVHRIDKETSGLIVVAKHDAAHQHLSAQLKDRSLSRDYAAICWGWPQPPGGTIDAPIARHPQSRQKMAVVAHGREARTHYQVMEIFQAPIKSGITPLASLIRCKLESGRTHQIRVHMAHITHPLLGDPVYGSSSASKLSRFRTYMPDATYEALMHFPRQALHAQRLELIHPISHECMRFESDLPIDMIDIIYQLKNLHR